MTIYNRVIANGYEAAGSDVKDRVAELIADDKSSKASKREEQVAISQNVDPQSMQQ